MANTEKIQMEIAEAIRSIRRRRRLNQTKFARLLFLEQPSVSRYEGSKRIPGTHILLFLSLLAETPAEIKAIRRALGGTCSFQEFVKHSAE